MNNASATTRAPAHFPRELTDLILTSLIHLHAHDPPTQWTLLRHMTRFHRTHIEHRFVTYWLPRLRILMYDVCPGLDAEPLEFKAHSVEKDTGIVHFRSTVDPEEEHPAMGWTWAEQLYSRAPGERCCVLRLDSPLLNEGYAGGGILSDTPIPDVRSDDTGMHLWFDWKALFSRMFTEEMVVRRAREEAVNVFKSGLRVTLKEKRNEAVWDALRKNYTALRGKALSASRAGSTPEPFKMQTRVVLPASSPDTAALIRREVSMVFFVPGWEQWNVREIAKYRAREEKANWNLFSCENVIPRARSVWWDNLEAKWRGWEGKEERTEEELEAELKICA